MSKDHLELVSPNGKNKISLSAKDDGCGIWLEDEGQPSVCLYVGYHQGAVLGFRKADNPSGPLDAAFSIAEGDKEICIQLLDKDKHPQVYNL